MTMCVHLHHLEGVIKLFNSITIECDPLKKDEMVSHIF
jgi:hypothetical protein